LDPLAEKVVENRMRRIAERRGFRVVKSRRRDPMALDYGGYMLVDGTTGAPVLGHIASAYSATLYDIEAFFNEQQ
jgi:hypothetical protein